MYKHYGTATNEIISNNKIELCYHNTKVVEYNKESGVIILDNGNYTTQTTKKRMNQFAAEWGLPFSVFSRDYQWYVCIYNDDTITNVIPFVGNKDIAFFIG